MGQSIFEILEFNKILALAAERAFSSIARDWFLATQPSSDLKHIKQGLSLVTELRTIIDTDESFPLDAFNDISTSIRKASTVGNFLNPQEFIELKKISLLSRKIFSFLKSRKDQFPLLFAIAAEMYPLKEVENEINRIIDAVTIGLKDNASRTLNKLRNEIKTNQNKIRRKLDSIQKSWARQGYLQEDLVTLREGRLVLMVKEGHRNQAKGIIHDQSSSGATLFMEPIETLEINNQIRRLKLEEQQEVERILIGLTDLIRDNAEAFLQNLNCLARFDHISTRAQLSAELEACQPNLNRSNKIQLIQAKHPLLLLRQIKRDGVVPLDLEIGDKFNTLIITGPNAGGKTVAIKTVGLLHLMVQSGFHVPVFPDSEFAIFDEIFADIGDMQSIENDLSTFSSRIRQIKQILESAKEHCLVLIDEIGSGTDPQEGAAFAKAVLEKLKQLNCNTIVTTHHGALKAFAHETAGIENGSMEFDQNTFEPTYKFRIGIPGSSYAFEIALRLGIPEEIVQRARMFVGNSKIKLENLIADLDQRITEQKRISDDLSIKQSKSDGLMKLYQERIESHRRNEKKLRKQAVEGADQILHQANAAIEQAIKEIKEKNASREAIKSAKKLVKTQQQAVTLQVKKLKKTETETGTKVTPEKLSLQDVAIGQPVFWKNFKSTATVIELPDASGRILVEAGSMKVRVPLNELSKASGKQKKTSAAEYVPLFKYSMPDHLSTEIDLRGMRLEDAIDEVDKFIDSALLAGLKELRIIHGKGTGALKNGINDFLKTHPRVKRKAQAAWNEGDAGATLIELEN